MPEDISERVNVILFSLIASFIALIAAYLLGFFRLPSRRTPPPPPLRLSDVIGVFALFLGIELILAPLIFVIWYVWKTGHWTSSIQLNDIQHGWFNILAVWIAAAGVLVFILSRDYRVRAIGLKSSGFFNHFFLGASLWFLAYPLVVLLDQLISLTVHWFFPYAPVEQVAVRQLKSVSQDKTLFLAMIFLIIFVVPILEELLFRGFLQTWLRQKLGRWTSITIAGIVFSLFHFSISQGIGNIEILLSLFLLALLLGFIYERQKSIWAPIGLHTAFNAASVAIIYWQL